MNFHIYKVKGINKSSGRLKYFKINAVSKEKALEEGLEKGIVEPFIDQVIQHPEPTKLQLDYAKDLGIIIPVGAKCPDISELIRICTEDDVPASVDLKNFAEGRGMHFSNYVGQKGLYGSIMNSFTGKDRVAFLIFQIYRHLSNDPNDNLDNHLYRDWVYEVAANLASDPKLLKSSLNYRGKHITFFGEKTVDGWTKSGGSTTTMAYKFIALNVSKEFNTKKTRTITEDTNRYQEHRKIISEPFPSGKKVENETSWNFLQEYKSILKKGGRDRNILLSSLAVILISVILILLKPYISP